jgi:hypothetical protein
MDKGSFITNLIPEHLESISIITVKAISATEPEKPFSVLINTADIIIGQPIFYFQMAYTERISL